MRAGSPLYSVGGDVAPWGAGMGSGVMTGGVFGMEADGAGAGFTVVGAVAPPLDDE